jgi:phage terminase large subunit-like protein
MTMLALLFTIMALLTPQQKFERLMMGKLARENLIAFARLTMPVPGHENDVRQSRYNPAEHHYFIAESVTRLVKTMQLRVGHEYPAKKPDFKPVRKMMLQVPFRHGKSELSVRRLVPWLLGKFPDKSGLVITHTDTLAREHGRDVRDVMRGDGYRLCFGSKRCQLREDSQAMDLLKVEGGGQVMFSGRKLGAGVGADWIIIDDMLKSSAEGRSKPVREEAWHAFVSDLKSRLNDESGWILFIGTRRHADDPPGRLTDPRNPHYDEREAAQWEVVRIPALSEGPATDPLGRAKDAPLWPERFSYEFWNAMRTNASITVREDFETQGQCNPVPSQGTFFKKEWWAGVDAAGKPTGKCTLYTPEQLPKRLRYYVASDHAITEDQRNDATVILPFGMDDKRDVWILPDVMWIRYESPEIIEAMLAVMRKYRPLQWAAEREHISKSILPLLRLRQVEERIFGYIEESSAVAHPEIRAWSIRGMMSMGRVHFPSFTTWWQNAEHELLEFPNGAHDDFVSALAHAGMLLDRVLAAEGGGDRKAPQPGTMAHFQAQQARSVTAGNLKGWS